MAAVTSTFSGFRILLGFWRTLSPVPISAGLLQCPRSPIQKAAACGHVRGILTIRRSPESGTNDIRSEHDKESVILWVFRCRIGVIGDTSYNPG